MVRQRLPDRPNVEPIDPTPGEPGGISAAVVVEFCKLIKIPVHVVHKNYKVYEWLPDGYEFWNRDQIRDCPRVMLNVYGEHAFFYERKAGQSIALMKVVDGKRTQPFRLGMHPSDTSKFRRVPYDEMVECSVVAL